MTVDVAAWLRSLGLGQYEGTFADQAIDAEALAELTDADLQQIGVLLGHRKKLLKAIAALGEPAPVAAARPTAGSARAERRHLTVMFVDLVGSTALSGRLDPEEMRDIIRSYQNAVAGEVTRFEGHVAKFMGDGVLAYFGWPRAHEDDAERAVRAGLAVLAAMTGLEAEGAPVMARVGIATGLVVVGDLVGEGAAQEEAVVGETPNLAARLQALAEPGQIVLAEATRRLLGGAFDLADLGERALKGIAGPVPAFAVLGERALDSRFAARQGDGLLPIVGREQELALLLERWHRAKAGEGQMVLLTGEAGIGKSRLTQALVDAVVAGPHVRLHYQCSPYHTDSTLYPAIQQLTMAAGLVTEDSNEQKLDKLEALLARGSAAPKAQVPLVAALLGVPSEGRYGALDLTPQQQRARTLGALIDQLIGLAASAPVLFVLEDAHWIDPTTLELIDLAIDRVARARVLLLITARPTFEHGFGGHPIVTRLMLNRLGRAQIEGIITHLTVDHRLSETLLDEIAARTDGVPLFVEELTKAILETGETTIPASLHDSLMARLDRIPEVKAVAQIAACIGREFDYALLAAIADRPEPDLRAALEKLGAAELIFRRGAAPEARYTFKHALVRDAAYESLLRSSREAIHTRLLEVLERGDGTAPEILARHAEYAGLIEKAIDYAHVAGQQALARPAYQEAIAHLAGAIRLIGRLEATPARRQKEVQLQILLGQAFIASLGHAHPSTEAAYQRASELTDMLGVVPSSLPVHYGLWTVHHVRSEVAAGRARAAAFHEMAWADDDDAYRMVASRMLATSLHQAGELAAADAHFSEALRCHETDRDEMLTQLVGQDQTVGVYCYRGLNLWCLGYPERARRLHHKAIERARTARHMSSRSYTLVHTALLACLMRDTTWLAQLTTELRALTLEYRQRLWEAMGQRAAFIGRIEAGSTDPDELDEGLAELRAAKAFMATGHARIFESFCDADAARALIGRGRLDEASALLGDARHAIAVTDEHWAMAEVHRVDGLLHLARGSKSDAETSFLQALQVARRQQGRSWELRAATSLARLWAEQGDRPRARDLLEPVYGGFTEGFETPDLIEARALLAALS